MHQTITDHERRTISIAAAWLSQALDDLHHQASNQRRMLNLYHGYHGELPEFMEATRRAWSITSRHRGRIRNAASYYFTVLEGEIMPPVGMTAVQAEAVAYGA